MTVVINYFNDSVKIFDNIKSINSSNNVHYVLVDFLNNEIMIPVKNVEYVIINKLDI